jgi:hypothetical protein
MKPSKKEMRGHIGWWHIWIYNGICYLCTPKQTIAIDYIEKISDKGFDEISDIVETMGKKVDMKGQRK